MDLDIFLEDDIPVFLDGFEEHRNTNVAESEINQLLTPMQQEAQTQEATNASSSPQFDFDPDKILRMDKPLKLQVENVVLQMGDEQQSYSSHKHAGTTHATSSLPSPDHPDVIPELFHKAKNATTADQMHMYSKALAYIDQGKRHEAVSLLAGLSAKFPHNLAYRTRLYDALRLPGGQKKEDSSLPETSPVDSPAPSLSESTDTKELEREFDQEAEREISQQAKKDSSDAITKHAVPKDISDLRRERMLNQYVEAVHLLHSGKQKEAKELFLDLARQNPHNLAIHLHLQELTEGETHD
jgi:TolA-binding protein